MPKQSVTAEVKTIIPEGKRITAKTVTIAGREVVLEEFCNYKVLEVSVALAGLIEDLGLDDLGLEDLMRDLSGLGEEPADEQLASVFLTSLLPVLPRIMQEAPRPLMHVAALCLIPNAVLKELYQGQPGAIAEEIEKELAWLKFDVTTADVITLLRAYLPYMGVEALKNKLAPALGGLLHKGQEVSTTAG